MPNLTPQEESLLLELKDFLHLSSTDNTRHLEQLIMTYHEDDIREVMTEMRLHERNPKTKPIKNRAGYFVTALTRTS